MTHSNRNFVVILAGSKANIKKTLVVVTVVVKDAVFSYKRDEEKNMLIEALKF